MRTRGMPWKETGPFAERRRFIVMARDSDESFTAICDRFGISRQKGYKWLARFEEGGLEALVDRSRRPHSNSRAVSTSVVELIVELRQRRPRWGPRKLLAILKRDYPRIEFPVASTVGSLLRAKGLVTKRRRRAPSVGYGAKLSAFVGPNSVWCADFKGQFLVAGRYCHPLTISDGYSRFLLRCKGLKRTLHAPVQKVFEDAFDEFGLPEVFERPHEALGQVEPAKLYLPSNRSYPRDLEDPAYPRHFTTQRAYPNGVITVGQTQWYLSGCLANQLIGLDAVADGCWRVCFGPVTLGLLDTRSSIKRNNRNFGLLIRMPNDARKRKSTLRRRMQD